MSHSTAFTLTQTLPIRRRVPGGLLALWTTQVAVAGLLLLAGGSKLAGAPAMVALFDAIGIGQWFRYVTGLIEVVAALALLVPSLAVWGALAVIPTMVGAIGTHLFVVSGSPAPATVLLFGALAIAWARRSQLVDVASKLR